MKVIIGGSKGGWWGKYVLFGTKNKPRAQEKIEFLAGNINIGERVTAQGKWTENEYTIVLGFKGKPLRYVVRKALKMFEKEFMVGFRKDEYHLDAVAHYDTDDTHVHIRIPKMNLLTGTQLQLYYHKKDVNRVNAIRDYINIKLDLDVSVNEKPLIAEDVDMRRIQAWREAQNSEPFDFTKKKTRNEAMAIINDKIRREHKAGNINDFNDLKDIFSENLRLDLGKPGHDVDKGHYFRIIVDDKIHRLFGEFYSEEFWEKERDQREQQFVKNVQTPKNEKLPPEEEALKHLEMYRRKRVEEISKKYAKSRGKARQNRGREEARARKYAEKKEKDELSRRKNQTVGSRETRAERSPRLERAVATAREADSTVINISGIIGGISGTDYRAITKTRRADKHRRSVTRGLVEVLAGATSSIKKYIKERIENGRISELVTRAKAIRADIQTRAKSFVSKLQEGIRELVSDSTGSLDGAEKNHQQAKRYDNAARKRSKRADEAVKFVDGIIKEVDERTKQRELMETGARAEVTEETQNETEKVQPASIIQSVLHEEKDLDKGVHKSNLGKL